MLSDSPNASITILANDNAYGVFMFSPPLQMSTEEGSAVRLRLVNISYNKIHLQELINFQHITYTIFGRIIKKKIYFFFEGGGEGVVRG